MKNSLRNCLMIVCMGAVVPFSSSAVSDFPSKPIRLIVPFNAGGSVDTAARSIVEIMSKDLGQPVVVENKAGANTTIGASQVARSNPDGYTLMLGSDSGLVLNPLIYKTLPYAPSDFTAVGEVIEGPLALLVHSKLPINTLSELIQYAKKHPGKLNYSSTGTGGAYHLAGEMLSQKAGIEITHVPYTGGSPATMALVSGQVDLMFSVAGTAMPFVKDGRVRALAVLSPTELSVYPGVPTMQEAGLSGFDMSAFFGIVAPAKTPPDVIDRLNRALNRVLVDPSFVQKFTDLGYLIPKAHSAEDFNARIVHERETWRALTDHLNLKLD